MTEQQKLEILKKHFRAKADAIKMYRLAMIAEPDLEISITFLFEWQLYADEAKELFNQLPDGEQVNHLFLSLGYPL